MMPSGERCSTCGEGIGCVRYGGGNFCSENCARYEFSPELFVRICRNCGLQKGAATDSCSCFGTLDRIVEKTEWERRLKEIVEEASQVVKEFKSAYTIDLEKKLEESRKRDKEIVRLSRDVVDKLTQEEMELVASIINQRLHGED